MAKRDFYEILGISKNANADEIKKAYRKKAIEFHPDKNPGDKTAEEKFKEAAEAYDVLSDANKKARYDQYGHAGMSSSGGGGGYGGGFSGGGMNMDDIFDQFGDIFGFGGGGSRGGGRKRNVNRGSNIRIKVKLTMEEIADGATKKVKINKYVGCDSCHGSGAKNSTSVKTCTTCNGSGQVAQIQNTILGRMQTVTSCPSCGGEGSVIADKCNKCFGDGVVRGEEVVEIKIPAGVEHDMQLSMSGKGNAGPRKGIAGDLLIVIEEEDHEQFKRDGQNIIYDLALNFADAALGTSVEIPTLGGKAKIKIDPGTQSGKVLRLKGKGLPSINAYGRGDQLIIVNIYTPHKLSNEEKKILEQLKTSKNFEPSADKKDRTFFDKMKDIFS
jgi:molecular chaperone DnaJ